jgi:hypothetical protein
MTSAEEHSAHDAKAKKAIAENIEQYGCHLALLSPTDYLPGFAYSIGLYQKFQHPELICFGLDQDVLGAVLNHARDLIEAGERLVPGIEYAGFLELPPYSNRKRYVPEGNSLLSLYLSSSIKVADDPGGIVQV